METLAFCTTHLVFFNARAVIDRGQRNLFLNAIFLAQMESHGENKEIRLSTVFASLESGIPSD
jgi:hypothetical protein